MLSQQRADRDEPVIGGAEHLPRRVQPLEAETLLDHQLVAGLQLGAHGVEVDLDVVRHLRIDDVPVQLPPDQRRRGDAVAYKPASRRLVVFDLKYGAGRAGRGDRQPAGPLLRARRLPRASTTSW